MKVKTSALCLLLLLSFSSAYATPPDQPLMTAARADLQQARAELLIAEHNKDGHRAKALQLTNAAIGEVNRGIAFDRRHNHAQPAASNEISSSNTLPDQPHMKAALDHLKSARSNLDRATADKGGHRAKAIELVNKAIDEVNAGIAAAS